VSLSFVEVGSVHVFKMVAVVGNSSQACLSVVSWSLEWVAVMSILDIGALISEVAKTRSCQVSEKKNYHN
jgi:hypothetical protein